jgi:hypothetical protein
MQILHVHAHRQQQSIKCHRRYSHAERGFSILNTPEGQLGAKDVLDSGLAHLFCSKTKKATSLILEPTEEPAAKKQKQKSEKKQSL